MIARPGELHPQLSHQLKETAPVIRSVLERLQGRPILIATPENAPVTNGRIMLVEHPENAVLPALSIEFTLRGVVFALEIPLGRVFDIVGTWNGTHYVYRLPSSRLRIERVGP